MGYENKVNVNQHMVFVFEYSDLKTSYTTQIENKKNVTLEDNFRKRITD